MNGREIEARATLDAIERAKGGHPIRVGPITSAYVSGSSFAVTVDLGWEQLVTDRGLSSVFLGELRAAVAATGSPAVMVGRNVLVHLTSGQQAVIAFTIGV